MIPYTYFPYYTLILYFSFFFCCMRELKFFIFVIPREGYFCYLTECNNAEFWGRSWNKSVEYFKSIRLRDSVSILFYEALLDKHFLLGDMHFVLWVTLSQNLSVLFSAFLSFLQVFNSVSSFSILHMSSLVYLNPLYMVEIRVPEIYLCRTIIVQRALRILFYTLW